jgi:hypothetical protein
MGYVHDTACSQFIAPHLFHLVTGTWTQAAGAVAGTTAMHKSANAETAVVTVPVLVPSNAAALKGSKVLSVELDYQLLAAAATSVTPALNLVTRGADTAVAVVAAVTITNNLLAASTAATQDKHKLISTVTTPTWLLNTQYLLYQVTFVCAGTVTIDLLGAVVNYTFRC